jgi:hypothetical protein
MAEPATQVTNLLSILLDLFLGLWDSTQLDAEYFPKNLAQIERLDTPRWGIARLEGEGYAPMTVIVTVTQ